MILSRLVRLAPEQRDRFDFTLFEPFAGISDEPITQFFPYIMRAYPNARVVLSTRNTTAWVNSRQTHHPMSPMPFSFLTRSIDDIYKLTTIDPQTDFNTSTNQFTERALRSGGGIAQAISKGEDPQDILWLRPNMQNLGSSTLAVELHNVLVMPALRPFCTPLRVSFRIVRMLARPISIAIEVTYARLLHVLIGMQTVMCRTHALLASATRRLLATPRLLSTFGVNVGDHNVWSGLMTS